MQLQCTAALTVHTPTLRATYPPGSPSAQCHRVGHCSTTEWSCCRGFCLENCVALYRGKTKSVHLYTPVIVCMCECFSCVYAHVWRICHCVNSHCIGSCSCKCCHHFHVSSQKYKHWLDLWVQTWRTLWPPRVCTLSKLELWQCGPRLRLSRRRALALSM